MLATAPTALVTGSSSGIGLDIAQAFLDLGWNVVINGRDAARLRSIEARLDKPDRIAAIAGNIAAPTTGQAMVHAARERFGGVDVLINNAGTFGAKPFVDVTAEELNHFVDENLKGTYITTQAAVREMKAQGRGGSIVNIGTVLVEHAMGGIPASAALSSKGGIHALTVVLAAELATDQIRVNAVAPGFINTPLMAGADHAMLADKALARRLGEVKDTTAAVLYLAQASFVTGHVLNVDGGYVKGRR